MEDRELAEEAVKEVNGQKFNGGRIRVELANSCSDTDRPLRGGEGGSRSR